MHCYGNARQSCISSKVVRGAGLEPAQYCYRQDLNLVRLPISPPARLKQETGPSNSQIYLTFTAPV